MNQLNNCVPSKEKCDAMCNVPALMKMFSNTLYIWGGAGVQLRTNSSCLAVPAPTLQEMLGLIRAYDATLNEEEGKILINGWYLTLIIGKEPVRCYNITILDEMAEACTTLVAALSKGK